MEDPKVNELWKHHSGRTYRVLFMTNTAHPSEKFPTAVVYENTDVGTLWSRPLSDWHRSFTRLSAGDTPSLVYKTHYDPESDTYVGGSVKWR